MKYITNQFKQGLKILIEGEPCSIISYEFHKPGKGQAVMRTKLYNLRTEKVWERTFKTNKLRTDKKYIDKMIKKFPEILDLQIWLMLLV